MVAAATESTQIETGVMRTDVSDVGRFIPLDDGVEHNPVTVETRRELDPGLIDPRLYSEAITTRVLCDRRDRSVRADIIVFVVRTMRVIGTRVFEYANAVRMDHANRCDVPTKSLGWSDVNEQQVETFVLTKAPGGGVLPMAD